MNEGSLFRFGNLTQPICAINNTYDNRFPNVGKTYAFSDGKYLLAPVTAPDISDDLNNSTKFVKWADIVPNTGRFGNPTLKVEGTDGVQHDCHIACLEGYRAVTGDDYDYGFGMVYADAATSNALTPTDGHIPHRCGRLSRQTPGINRGPPCWSPSFADGRLDVLISPEVPTPDTYI